MKRLGQWLLSVVLLGGLVAGGLWAYQAYLAPAPPTPAPTAGPVEAPRILAEGRLAPIREAVLAYRAGGRIAQVLAAEGEAVAAGQVLVGLEVAEAEAALTQARAAVEMARAQAALVPAGAAAEQLALAAAQVKQAEGLLEAARAARAEAELRAPFDGTVVALAAEVGEVAPPGAMVAVVADLSGWQLHTLDLREEDVVRLRVGQRAEVKIAALPGEVFVGRISAIALDASSYQGNVTYAVTIDLAPTAAPLSWGMTAFVEIDPAPAGAAAAEAPTAVAARRGERPTPTTPPRVSAATAAPVATATAPLAPTAASGAPLATPTALAGLSASAAAPVVHVVVRGENLYRIALRYDTTIRALMTANGLTSTLVVAGQRLVVP